MAKKRLRVVVEGRVQGVFFRATVRENAQKLGLSGFVKNNSDGSVEAVFEGEEPFLKEILRICKIGPPAAKVKNVIVGWKPFTGEFRGFKLGG